MKNVFYLKSVLILLLCMVTNVGVRAEEEISYSLIPAVGTNNVYANNCDVTVSDIIWNVTGNSTITPWRIGGKSISSVNRSIYSKTTLTDDITKVVVSNGAASNITVNSFKLIVSTNANGGGTVTDEITGTFSANGTTTFTRPEGHNWKDKFFKFVYNVSVSGNNNKFVEFCKADFYRESNPADTRAAVNMSTFTTVGGGTSIVKGNTLATSVTNDQSGWTASYIYSSDNVSVATVNTSGIITAVAKGTATITASLNVSATDASYKTGTTTSKSIEITVTPLTHKVYFSANGTILNDGGTDVEEGEAIAFPAKPANINGKTFVGWYGSNYSNKTKAPTFVTSATMGESDVTYYAVFATKEINLTASLITSASDLIAGNAYYISSASSYSSDAVAMGKNSGANNFPATTFAEAPVLLTLGGDASGGWTFSYEDVVDGNPTILYLDPTSDKTKNYLKTNTNITNYGKFSISFSDDAAVITSKGKDVRNILRYNATNGLFSCYSSGQEPVYLYAGSSASYSDYCTEIPAGSITIGSTGYATYCPTADVTIPAGVKAYAVTATTNTAISLTEITDKIKKDTGVILNGTPSTTYNFVETTGATAFEGNKLVGTTAATSLSAGDAYILANQSGSAVFSKCSAGTLAAGKAYLPASEVPATAGALKIVIDDEATSIQSTTEATGYRVQTTGMYNLAGQKVSADYKGIVIKNGKRVVVK